MMKWLEIGKGVGLKITCCLIIIFIPALHLGFLYKFWAKPREVNEEHCTCSCWDGYFKGSYERSVPRYKNIYFNSNLESFVIWSIAISFFIFIYESSKFILELFITHKLRATMVVSFLSSFYANYYSWWMYFNAFNDRFYDQLAHQTIFAFTEMISSCLMLTNMNSDNPANTKHLLLMLTIALLHIIIGAMDQFVSNVIFRQGFMFQITRDLGFLGGDVCTCITTIVELFRSDLKSYWDVSKIASKKELVLLIMACLVLGFASF